MAAAVVVAEGISKRYELGAAVRGYSTLRESLASAIRSPLQTLRGSQTPAEHIWALRNVTFEVQPGEALGIVGNNGAGKSTLLKILSRITQPTGGTVRLRGRVGSLLEVGTGFHGELTGRENIYLNGAILGMKRTDVRRKFDAIVAFSEVERFIDTPVKRYSSGMYMRLAFAVAAHLEPEILIIDEVLAVGDGRFQEKCLDKMHEVANQGRTVIFVSHNLLAVRNLCSRAILLADGEIVSSGSANQVVDEYVARHAGDAAALERTWGPTEEAPGNESIRVTGVRIQPRHPKGTGGVFLDDELVMEVDYQTLKPGLRLVLNAALYTAEGVAVFDSVTPDNLYWHGRECPRGDFRGRVVIPPCLLNDRRYRLRIVFLDAKAATVFDFTDALWFTPRERGDRPIPFLGTWQGVIRPVLEWEVEQLGSGSGSP